MRVVIAEDQVLLREGLGRLFADRGHEVQRPWETHGSWSRRSQDTALSWSWSTSGCRRPSPTKALAPLMR